VHRSAGKIIDCTAWYTWYSMLGPSGINSSPANIFIPGVLNRWKPIIGNPIDQSMVFDVNYLIDIDWHWSIDDQSIVTKKL
jgi:hypothetical protein